MQISRHWRLNAQRYRLEGVRYEDGTVDLQGRPMPLEMEPVVEVNQTEPRAEKIEAVVTHRLVS